MDQITIIVLLIATVIILSIILGLLLGRRRESANRQLPSPSKNQESPNAPSDSSLNILNKLESIEAKIDRSGFFSRAYNLFVFGIALTVGGISVFLTTLIMQKQGIPIVYADFITNRWFLVAAIGLCLAVAGIILMFRSRRPRN